MGTWLVHVHELWHELRAARPAPLVVALLSAPMAALLASPAVDVVVPLRRVSPAAPIRIVVPRWALRCKASLAMSLLGPALRAAVHAFVVTLEGALVGHLVVGCVICGWRAGRERGAADLV